MTNRRIASLLLALTILTPACASQPPPPAAAPPAAALAAPPPAASTPTAPGISTGEPGAGLGRPARPPQAILADAVEATGGPAAWAAHQSMHTRMELTFQGMGIGGSGERFSTKSDKALTVTDLPGIGAVREGGNGKTFWAQDPVNGLRLLEGAEAEQARVESAWNPEERLSEFYARVESRTEPGASGAPLECIVLTPKVGGPLTNCYDPATHLQVLQKGTRSTPQGDTPFVSTLKDWRDAGGVKMAFGVDTQAGPITFSARITDVKFDEPMDDKMFEPPVPGGGAPAKK